MRLPWQTFALPKTAKPQRPGAVFLPGATSALGLLLEEMLSLKESRNPLIIFGFCALALASTACSTGPDDEGDEGTGGSTAAGGSTASGGADSASGGADVSGSGGSAELEYIFCGPVDTCPPSTDGMDLTTPVSFRNDIYTPFFFPGCVGAGCHGHPTMSAADLYFGSAGTAAADPLPLTDAEITALITQLKGPAVIGTSAMNVVPSNWQESFLMMKLDGCQSQHGVTCDQENESLVGNNLCEQTCGDGMPLSEGDAVNPFPFATTPQELVAVNKVRAWIAQGALDN